MIKFYCPSCHIKLGVPDEYAGHRVRCSKCDQPSVVPQPIAEIAAQSKIPQPVEMPAIPSAPVRSEHQSSTQSSSAASASPQTASQADTPHIHKTMPLRQTSQFMLAGKRINSPAHKTNTKSPAAPKRPAKVNKPNKPNKPRKSNTSFAPTDIIPDILHFPLSLVLGTVFMAVVVGIWIIASRTTQSPLGFFMLFVFLAAATGIRLLSVNQTFIAGIMAIILGAAGLVVGRAAVAKYVVTPWLHLKAEQEVLTDIPPLLSDPKTQLAANESVSSIAKDGDFMACFAIIISVDQNGADPVAARKIALHILRSSNKTNLMAMLSQAGTTPERPSLGDLDDTELQVMVKAQWYIDRWLENDSECFAAARKYYPVLMKLTQQCELQRTLEDPKKTFIIAMIMTLGVLDIAWILMGMTAAYLIASLDV